MLYFRFLRTAFLPLLVYSAAAQNAADVFSKPPTDVDDALRARIAKFYQAQVDGKARRAEDVVAEDSKDFFYSLAKPKFFSFEIRDITYSDNFTKAKAVIVVEMYIMMPGFEGKPMKVPGSTTWKLENGQWCWYIDPDVLNTTPFGKMKSDGSAPAAGAPDTRGAPTLESLTQQVRASKQRVELKTGEASSDQVTVHNGMPGSIRIELRHPDQPGLEIKADRTEIPAGQNAVVSFHYEPVKDTTPRPLGVDLEIEPTNTLLQFFVTFK